MKSVQQIYYILACLLKGIFYYKDMLKLLHGLKWGGGLHYIYSSSGTWSNNRQLLCGHHIQNNRQDQHNDSAATLDFQAVDFKH